MRRGDNKKGIVIASITMGIIGVFLLNIFKRSLEQIPLIKKIVNYKRVGVDSLKDFLELGELRLRLENLEDGIIPLYDGVKIMWDSDESEDYTILLSNTHISKIEMIDCENFQHFVLEEINDNEIWKRKIIIDKKEIEEKEQWDENLEEWHSAIKLEDEDLNTFYIVPLDNFYCRVKSSNGRISNELKYPPSGKMKEDSQVINAWVTKTENIWYIHIRENNNYKIYNYKVVLYMEDGKGIIRTVPPFSNYIKLKLGSLPPCLCYIRGMRSVGTTVEEYVAWINEEKALHIEL